MQTRDKNATVRPMTDPGRKVLLVVVEPAIDPRAVVDRACRIAALDDCRLHFLLADVDVSSVAQRFLVSNEAREIAARIREAQEAILDDLAAPVRARGLEVETEILEQRPVADAVLQRALEIDPLMVVKGTQHHSQAERAVFVDTDWRLIRKLPYPLWLVKPREFAAAPVVIAAVDPTHREDEAARLDRLIVGQARRIADRARGRLLLLHTFEPLTGVGAEATLTFKPIRLPVAELGEKMEREHRARLDALADDCGVARADSHQLPGRARDLLPWYARDKEADLVVMGALARGAAGDVLGSTAERVLDDLPCDILIVKPA